MVPMLEYLVIAVATLCFLYYLGTRSARQLEQFFPGFPGPKPWAFIGNTLDFIKTKAQLHLYFDEKVKEYGRLFSISSRGLPALVVSDPEMIKDILVKRFDCFQDRPVSVLKIAYSLRLCYLEPLDKSILNFCCLL